MSLPYSQIELAGEFFRTLRVLSARDETAPDRLGRARAAGTLLPCSHERERSRSGRQRCRDPGIPGDRRSRCRFIAPCGRFDRRPRCRAHSITRFRVRRRAIDTSAGEALDACRCLRHLADDACSRSAERRGRRAAQHHAPRDRSTGQFAGRPVRFYLFAFGSAVHPSIDWLPARPHPLAPACARRSRHSACPACAARRSASPIRPDDPITFAVESVSA